MCASVNFSFQLNGSQTKRTAVCVIIKCVCLHVEFTEVILEFESYVCVFFRRG